MWTRLRLWWANRRLAALAADADAWAAQVNAHVERAKAKKRAACTKRPHRRPRHVDRPRVTSHSPDRADLSFLFAKRREDG